MIPGYVFGPGYPPIVDPREIVEDWSGSPEKLLEVLLYAIRQHAHTRELLDIGYRWLLEQCSYQFARHREIMRIAFRPWHIKFSHRPEDEQRERRWARERFAKIRVLFDESDELLEDFVWDIIYVRSSRSEAARRLAVDRELALSWACVLADALSSRVWTTAEVEMAYASR